MARARLILFAVPALLLAARPVSAQRALGIGDDASTLPAGMLRLTIGALWDRANERYDASGRLRPLGANASTTSWNGLYDARLMSANPLVRSLSGLTNFDASLGALAIGRRDASADDAFGVELGVLSRITVGVRARVASHVIEPDLVLNPGLVEGTMGFNPAWAFPGASGRNTLIVTQFDSAVAQTSRRIAQCQATPAAAGCAGIVANVAGAQALVSSATGFAAALNALYGGRTNAVGLPFVPRYGSAAHAAIEQRMLGYRDQFVALGNTTIGTQGPAGAALFSPADLATMLKDSVYGYLLRPLRTVHAYGPGELSVHVKARLFQTVGVDTASIRGFAMRQAAGVTLRLNGGSSPARDELFAPVTGDAGRGFVAQSFTDLFYGNRCSATVVLGIDQSQTQAFAMRIPPAGTPAVGGVPFPLVMADREVGVTRSPGSRLDVSVTPRVALTRSIWLGANWSMSRQAADTWRVSSSAASDIAVNGTMQDDANAWAAGSDWSAQQLAVGGTYSTTDAARHGRTKKAFDVTYEHLQTLAGRGTRVPHLTRDVVTVRWYPRAWGR